MLLEEWQINWTKQLCGDRGKRKEPKTMDGNELTNKWCWENYMGEGIILDP